MVPISPQKRLHKFLILLLAFLPFLGLAQNSAGDLLKAKFESASELIPQGEYALAIDSLNAVLAYADKNNLGRTASASDILHKLGVAKYLLNNYEDAIESYSASLKIRNEIYEPNHLDIARSNHNIGTCYEYMGEHFDAIEYLKNGLEIRKHKEVPDDEAYSYFRIGVNYKNLGDYNRALEFYEPALEIYLRIYGQNDSDVAEAYNEIGIAYFNKNDLDNALTNLTRSYETYKKINDIEGQIHTANNLGGCYYIQRDYTNALKFYNQSLSINKDVLPSAIPRNLTNIGLVYTQLGQFSEAKKNLERGLELVTKLRGDHDPAVASYLENLAELEFQKGELNQAIEYYNRGITLLVPGFHPKEPHQLPLLGSDRLIGSKSLLLTLLSNKAKTYYKQWKNTGADLSLKYSLLTYVGVDSLINLMRSEHRAKASKLFWTSKVMPIYESAISCALQLLENTGDSKYLEQAFFFNEKNKSLLLLESLKEDAAKKFVGIPDGLIQQENLLKKEVTKLEQELFSITQSNEKPDDERTKKLNREVFNKRESLRNFISIIEKDHPEYHRMKYDPGVISMAEISNLLPENSTMVEYFVGDSSLVIFLIDKRRTSYLKLLKPENLENLVASFRSSLMDYFMIPNANDSLYSSLCETYASISFSLYNQIIAPIVSVNIKPNLIIVPDGAMGYIPFDALLISMPDNVQKFRSHNYLMNKWQISYAYSGTLWKEMISGSDRKKRKQLLAVAPSFQNSAETDRRQDLSPLLFNEKEVSAITAYIDGKILTGESATESRFRELAPDFSILHFATHGWANDENPDYSYLAFTEIVDSIENEFLYVHDLYNMKLNADLVVLSACETGIGKLYRGEGIASLAKGFSYAGASSLVTTLWSVNDAQTADIMSRFYKHLSSGESKDEALRNAKIEYIRNSDNFLAHPYFWAASIPIGDMSVVELGRKFNWWWMLALVPIFLVLFFLKHIRHIRLFTSLQ